ncbi:NADPH-dependent F420 reductase [Cognatiyoonia sp. IB215182]|uniref:NADPH-dependent F420 reductase n=1 Tax=Cognatiyoonia sp. IB215182 TaxID=3097353 RepID=UPI002A10CF4F|nr:NAD(P)-binding domain-containing protein [Cognatiyoonia sp. IB215182]MDX8355032.1 NAD(P)-binding domain-containing protein [Cognatiyoonia sp. IB215182]
MRIGIIGYGNMARALAGRWVKEHEIMLSGRNLDKAAEAARSLNIKSGSIAEAAGFGEVVVFATHNAAVFDAIEQAGGARAFADKVVIDINNPIDTKTFLTTRTDGLSLTEAIADALPGAYVGKAFNMAQARVWADPDKSFDGRAMVTPYTADEAADEMLATLIADVGSEPLRLGGNEHAYKLEAAAAIVIQVLFAGGDAHTVLNLIRPEAKPIR